MIWPPKKQFEDLRSYHEIDKAIGWNACLDACKSAYEQFQHSDPIVGGHVDTSVFPTEKNELEFEENHPVLKITPSQKYYDFFATQIILYGEAFVDWYKKEGLQVFDEWAKKQWLDFIDTKQTELTLDKLDYRDTRGAELGNELPTAKSENPQDKSMIVGRIKAWKEFESKMSPEGTLPQRNVSVEEIEILREKAWKYDQLSK